MFQDCKLLKKLDLSSFTNPKLMNIRDIFSGCSSLSSLDISSFNSSLVTSMDNAFSEVPNEGELRYSSKLLTTNLLNLVPSGWKKTDVSETTPLL